MSDDWWPSWATPEQIAETLAAEPYSRQTEAQAAELDRTAAMLAGGDARLAAGIRSALDRAWSLGWRTGIAWADRPGGSYREAFRTDEAR